MGTGDRILIIKLAALGDVVQALGPFAAIRAHHRDARVVLLTTAPYQDLARATGLFDDIWLDERPRGVDLAGWMRLRAALRAGQFDRVYDLQTSDRSSFYLRLFWPGPRPRWSGIAKGCSHPHANPLRDTLHTLDRQAEQLAMAGIETVPQPGTALTGNDFQAASPEFLSNLGLRPPFALLIPGGAAHRPASGLSARDWNIAPEPRTRAFDMGAEPLRSAPGSRSGLGLLGVAAESRVVGWNEPAGIDEERSPRYLLGQEEHGPRRT